jgi:hypothetical protein
MKLERRSHEETSGAVYQDCGRATADEKGVGAGRRAYVLVNNRAEGNAPLTVEALLGMLRGSCCGPQDPSILVLVLSPREILPLRLTFHPSSDIVRDKALLSSFRGVAII